MPIFEYSESEDAAGEKSAEMSCITGIGAAGVPVERGDAYIEDDERDEDEETPAADVPRFGGLGRPIGVHSLLENERVVLPVEQQARQVRAGQRVHAA